MSDSNSTGSMKIADTTGNPAPLGLLGFGMTTILLNIHNAGLTGLDTMIMGMGIFVGGLAQVIAGIQEWKKNNTFGATAFTAYGFFWIALVATWVLPALGQPKAAPLAMAFFLTVWGLFTLGMFFGTLRLNKALQVVFSTLTILFFGLATRDFLQVAQSPLASIVGRASGWTGIACGLSALYTSLAQVLNEVWGRTILPLGPVAKHS